jgi:hypothetical protein
MSDKDENYDISKFTAGDNFFGQMKEAGVADDAFIREIVDMFLTEGGVSLDKITEGFKNDDLSLIRLYSHKLKSSFLMFDMLDAHKHAAELEHVSLPLTTSLKTLNELKAICDRSFKLLQLKYLV